MVVGQTLPVDSEHRCGLCGGDIYFGTNPHDPWAEDMWRACVDGEYMCPGVHQQGELPRHRPALPDLTDPKDVEAWLTE